MDTVIGRYIDPQTVPDYDEFVLDERQIVTVPAGSAKPYAVRRSGPDRLLPPPRRHRAARGREQTARLFQSGGLVSVEKMPVHSSSLADLDMRWLEEYFLAVLGEDAVREWQRTLLNRELLAADQWRPEACNCSHAGIVLFAREPRRRMPQAGTRLLGFPGADMDYDATWTRCSTFPLSG